MVCPVVELVEQCLYAHHVGLFMACDAVYQQVLIIQWVVQKKYNYCQKSSIAVSFASSINNIAHVLFLAGERACTKAAPYRGST
jgi:hypothetical protein